MSVYQQVLTIAIPYFENQIKADQFLVRQCKSHLNREPTQLDHGFRGNEDWQRNSRRTERQDSLSQNDQPSIGITTAFSITAIARE
jgi:hypothetical protein